MSDQSDYWSQAAERYEEDFIDPDLPGGRNPVRPALAALADANHTSVADLGCGTGPLLPYLASLFRRVIAIDFAPGMLDRARQRCQHLDNIHFHQRSLSDLGDIEPVDVAVAVNSFVMPDLDELHRCLKATHQQIRPGGTFLGIVPSMDGVHYLTMLLLDRARRTGMPLAQVRKNAASHADHSMYDFAFGEFRFRGLVQHFWHKFEIPYRLRQAGFRQVHVGKAPLAWEQFRCGKELSRHPPPWDWFFRAVKPI
jgi:SAM-dependent methyltransferase